MTITRGIRILAAPCCGATYAFPNYVSLNFSAFEYWSDGWRVGALLAIDEGLRRCRCGQFVLLSSLVQMDAPQGAELPVMNSVPVDDLPACIAQAGDADIEIAARLVYWRHLNHGYREAYRPIHDALAVAARADWEQAHTDRRSRLDRWLGRPAPAPYWPADDDPASSPPFAPTPEQVANMARLSSLLDDRRATLHAVRVLALAELYREQGCFDQAETALLRLGGHDSGAAGRWIARGVHERRSSPMRYRC